MRFREFLKLENDAAIPAVQPASVPDVPFGHCQDCGRDISKMREYYSVRDDVWQQATGGSPKIMLCIGCLETRLGRRLNKDDFTTALVNHGPKCGARMLNRLQGRFNGSEEWQQNRDDPIDAARLGARLKARKALRGKGLAIPPEFRKWKVWPY